MAYEEHDSARLCSGTATKRILGELA